MGSNSDVEWKGGRWLDEIMTGPLVRAEVLMRADGIVSRARGMVPVDSGELRASIKSRTVKSSQMPDQEYDGPGDRWIGVAYAEAPYAAKIEFGFNGKPGLHFMKRAANLPGKPRRKS
jgi:hypothetical protein